MVKPIGITPDGVYRDYEESPRRGCSYEEAACSASGHFPPSGMYTSRSRRKSQLDAITKNAVETRKNLHQHLKGKALYSALCGVYTEVLHELKGVLQSSVAPREAENRAAETETPNEEFGEQRRRKRNSSDGQATKPKKPPAPATSANDPRLRRQEGPTRTPQGVP
jgi:hypothetical protein